MRSCTGLLGARTPAACRLGSGAAPGLSELREGEGAELTHDVKRLWPMGAPGGAAAEPSAYKRAALPISPATVTLAS